MWAVIKETKWSFHYLLWKVSWINVQMMLADAPSYTTKSAGDKKDNRKVVENDEELIEFLGL